MTLPVHYAHQAATLLRSQHLPYFACFWDQGTGKTRYVLDTMVHLARQGEIDTLLVLAPNGVHQMWIEDEVPKWVPGSRKLTTAFYTSGKAKTIKHQRAMDKVLHAPFSVVAMSYEGLMTKLGRAWVRKLLRQRKVLMVCDESTAIKTPSAKRTIAILAAGKLAKYQRILTGTPADAGPFDVYTQMKFLDPDFWKNYGFHSYAAFKVFFGVFTKKNATRYNPRTRMTETYQYDDLVCYRNLDKLREILQEHSSRVEKDVVLDLPPKVYTKIYCDLTPVQKRMYQELKQEQMTFLESGELITIQWQLTVYLRLQQIICGYIPVETGEPEIEIVPADKNPRLNAFKQAIENYPGQAIIWARFNKDIDNIMAVLGTQAVQCDGRVPAADRQAAIKQFQAGKLQYIVSKPQTKGMSRGQTLTNAQTVIYYSNTFSLEDRRQSEDRAHRGGLKHTVTYIDIVAPATIDTRIVGSLRSKKEVAATIMGDDKKEWI